MNNNINLICGDCLDVMGQIPAESVDMILCDLPYGCLNKKNPGAKWDSQIPLEPLWEEYRRVIRPKGAIVLFGSGMFTAELMFSNRKWWRYNLVWKKGEKGTNFLNANRAPLRNHEDILIFCSGRTVYHPQMEYAGPHRRNHGKGRMEKQLVNNCYGDFVSLPAVISDEKFLKSVLNFNTDHPAVHPTQKPVKLLEWLIRTYSDEGDTVLDNCMGYGSTGVACVHTGRRFIGIEKDEEWFHRAKERIEAAEPEKQISMEIPTLADLTEGDNAKH